MSDKIDGPGDASLSERAALEAKIAHLRKVAEGMDDREAATRLIMQILAMEVELLGKE